MSLAHLALAVAIAVPAAPQVQHKAQTPTSQTLPNSTTAVVPGQLRRVGPPPPNASAANLEETGDELRGENDFPDALDYYDAAIKKADSPVLHDKAGIAHLEMFRAHDAEKDFKRAVKMNPHYAEAWNNLGVVAYMTRKYGKAVKLYDKAIKLNANTAAFHSNLGSVYFVRKEFDKAANEYGRALQLDPTIFDPARSGGVVMRAISAQDRGLYDYVIARIYANTGNSDGCLLYLEKAIEDGYSNIKQVYKDPQFAKIRKDPRFVSLMSAKPLAVTN